LNLAQGLSSSAIARMLRLSERTVEWHALQAMKRLDAKNRIQAVVLAIRDGLIALEQKPLNQGYGVVCRQLFLLAKKGISNASPWATPRSICTEW
jgi:hypothetical protein